MSRGARRRVADARIGILLALACAAPACTDGLVAGNGYDGALITISGELDPIGFLSAFATANPDAPPLKPIVSLLWTDPLQRWPDVPAPARWLSSSVSIEDDDFELKVFRPPPPEALVDVPGPSGQTVRLAFGEMVLIDDQDGDGTFTVDGLDAAIKGSDQYLGASTSVLVYLADDQPAPPANYPLYVSGGAGYQLLYYVCDKQTISQTYTPLSHDVAIIVQPSRLFPSTRACARTHSP